MRRGTALFMAIALATLTAGAHRAPAAGDAPYPIWWSPGLWLESLDAIDGTLQDIFPREEQFHVVKYDVIRVDLDQLIDEYKPELGYNWKLGRENVREQWIDTCRSLIRWTEEGYWTDLDHPYGFHALELFISNSAYCYTLDALKGARPARESHVRDFVFKRNALEHMPAMIGLGWDCKSIREFLDANRSGTSWAAFAPDYFTKHQPNYELEVIDDNTLVVKDIVEPGSPYAGQVSSEHRLTIQARADMNGDGLDDVLIRAEDGFTSPRGEWVSNQPALYLITRRGTNDALRVVEYYGPSPIEGIRCRPTADELTAE